MLLDAIATVILAGLMLIPLLNVIVGGVIGAGLLGPFGGVMGIVLAIAITALETWVADRLGWRDLRSRAADALESVADEVAAATERTITTGRPSRRRQSYRAHEPTSARRPSRPNNKMQHGVAR